MGQNQSHRPEEDGAAPPADAPHAPSPSHPNPPFLHARVPSDFLSSPFTSLRQSLFASFAPTPSLASDLFTHAAHPPSTTTTFPRLTVAQMTELRDHGVDLDLTFVPYQMPRLTTATWGMAEREGEREKKCLRVVNPLSIKSVKLVSHPLPSTALHSSSTPPSRLSLSITLDLSVSCRLSLYPCATELIDRTLPDQLPSFTTHPDCHSHESTLPPGLNQSLVLPLSSLYPSHLLQQMVGGGEAVRGGVPSLFTFSSSRHYFPLILHIERLSSPVQTEKGEEEVKEERRDATTVDHLIAYYIMSRPRDRRTPSVPLGAAPPPPPPSDGVVSIKRLKQKVKVQHKSYEVAEVYGLPPPVSPSGSPPPASSESPECVICLTSRRTHAIFPCRHLCLCLDCAGMLREQTNRCPICRRAVETVIPILLEEGTGEVGDEAAGVAREQGVRLEVRDE